MHFKFSSIISLSLITLVSLPATAQKRQKNHPAAVKPAPQTAKHENYMFSPNLFTTKLDTLVSQNAGFRFQYTDSSKNGLRSISNGSLFGMKTGETLINGKDGVTSSVNISIYNRGDDGARPSAVVKKQYAAFKKSITEKLGVEPKERESNGAVKSISLYWKNETSAYLLEFSGGKNGAEYLRIRMLPAKGSHRTERTANRTSLRKNVERESNGDVWISNIPMVDQGRKGYCACASAARIYQYYGRSTDQHEIAQLAGSSTQGTTMPKMVSALTKITSKMDSRVVVLYTYPKYITLNPKELSSNSFNSKIKSAHREVKADFNKYQSLAKKADKKQITLNGKEGGRISANSYVNFYHFYSIADPEVYKDMMTGKTNYSHFQSSIKKYIDDGIPVAWALQLGKYKEPKIPQVGGGHMRLIIGNTTDCKDFGGAMVSTERWKYWLHVEVYRLAS